MLRFSKKSVKSMDTDIPSEQLTIRLDSLKNKKKDKQDTRKVALQFYARTPPLCGGHNADLQYRSQTLSLINALQNFSTFISNSIQRYNYHINLYYYKTHHLSKSISAISRYCISHPSSLYRRSLQIRSSQDAKKT